MTGSGTRRAAFSLALLLTLGVSVLIVGAPVAQASGSGCAPISPSQLAQPGVAPVGGATLTLDRSQGVAGTLLTLSGANWPANVPIVVDMFVNQFVNQGETLVVDTSGLAQNVMTTANGQLPRVQFRAPQSEFCPNMNLLDPTGGMVLFVAHTLRIKARASALFTYLPSPQLMSLKAPGITPSGQIVSLVGSGWSPGDTVTITTRLAALPPSDGNPTPSPLRPDPASAAHVTADARGGFTLDYRLPDVGVVSQANLYASATDARFGDVEIPWVGGFTLLPTDSPTLTLDHAQVSPGGQVTLTGAHWPAGVRVTLEYCRGQRQLPPITSLRCLPNATQRLGSATPNAQGAFTATVRLPANAQPGPVTIQARIPNAPLNLQVYAQGQALTILATFVQAHPRLMGWLALAPWWLTGVALVVLLILADRAFIRRHARPAVSEDGLHIESLDESDAKP